MTALIVVAFVSTLVSFLTSQHFFDKKVTKLYQEQVAQLQETQTLAFNDGWQRGEAYGRIQALLDHQEDMRNGE